MAKSLFTDTARPRIKNFMTAVMTKMSLTAGKRAPRRCAPTKTAHIPLPKAARRGGYPNYLLRTHSRKNGFSKRYSPCGIKNVLVVI